MPQLEARRAARPVATSRLHCLTLRSDDLLDAAARRWALSWGLLHLAGFALGGTLAVPDTWIAPVGANVWTTRAAAALVLLLTARRRSVLATVWILVFALSVTSGVLEKNQRTARQAAAAPDPWSPAVSRTVCGAAVLRTTGWAGAVPGTEPRWRGAARIAAWKGWEIGEDLRGAGVLVTGRGAEPLPGALLAGRLELKVPAVAALPGGFDYRAFLAGRGLFWQGKLEHSAALPASDPAGWLGAHVAGPVRTDLLRRLDALLPRFESDLAAAVLLGKRTAESRAASRPFADLGLAHLFSVSGLHVGILLGIFLLPGRRLGWSPAALVGPLLFVLPLYAVLTGLPGSVLRAAGLGFLGSAALMAGRRADALHLVGLLFWIGAVWEPGQILDGGLRLSYLAAGGILAVSVRAVDSGVLGDGWRRAAAAGLGVSLAAQWFTLPQIAASFGKISLLSPAANVIAVPVFGAALWLIVAALAAHPWFPWLGESIAAVAWVLLRALAGGAGRASAVTGGWELGLPVPGVVRVLVLAGLSGILLLLLNPGRAWSRPKRRSGILMTLALGFLLVAPWGADPAGSSSPVVWQVDVGQGDCSLVFFPDGWTGLIDTGGRFGRSRRADGPLSRSLLPFLRRGGRNGIDDVVLTHDHLDHTGGVPALLSGLQVGRFLCGGRSADRVDEIDIGAETIAPVAGDVLHRWRKWRLEVLYPCGELPAGFHENDRSIVVGLFRDEHCAMLFSGDLEVAGEAVWRDCGTMPREVGIWKTGHHGSDTSAATETLERMRPDLVLISCGVGNRYEHPSHGPYTAGEDTIPILRTDLHGTVRVEWDEAGKSRIRTLGTAPAPGRLDSRGGRL